MGNRLAHLEPIHGFAAETPAAVLIQVASRLGFPLSPTHVISASLLGVGASRRLTAVRRAAASARVNARPSRIPVAAVLGCLAAQLARGLH